MLPLACPAVDGDGKKANWTLIPVAVTWPLLTPWCPPRDYSKYMQSSFSIHTNHRALGSLRTSAWTGATDGPSKQSQRREAARVRGPAGIDTLHVCRPALLTRTLADGFSRFLCNSS